jgi:hypothetical protein
MEKKLSTAEKLDLEATLIDVVYSVNEQSWNRWGEGAAPVDYLDAIIDLLREKGIL